MLQAVEKKRVISLTNFISDQTKITWLVFLGGLLLFVINTFGLNFGFGVEESRYVFFAQEMLRQGLTPFPILYGHPYPDYPATHTILIYLGSLFGHQVTPFTAILPSALASALILAITYRIAATHSARWGLYAVLFLLATYEFLLLARTPSPDPLVALVTVASFYWVYTGKAPWVLLGFFVGGFLVRGPIGLVIPALVIGVFYFLEKNYKAFFWIAGSSAMLLVLCTGIQLWIAEEVSGIAFAHEVFFMEAGGRINNLGQRAFYYYFVNGLGGYALAFPMAVLTLISYRKKIFKSETTPAMRLLKQLAGWAFIILLVLSFPKEKHFRYIIAAAPAFALIAAYGLAGNARPYGLVKLQTAFTFVSKVLPWFSVLVLAGLFFAKQGSLLHINYAASVPILGLLALTTLWLSRMKLIQENRQLVFFSVGVATLLTIFIFVAQPLAEQYITSVKPLLDKVVAQRKPEQQIVFYQIEPDREGLKFSVLLNKSIPEVFIETPQQLMQFKQPAIFVTAKKIFDTLGATTKDQFKILWQEKSARNWWVVFINNS